MLSEKFDAVWTFFLRRLDQIGWRGKNTASDAATCAERGDPPRRLCLGHERVVVGLIIRYVAIQFMQYYTEDKWALVMRGFGGSLQSLSADSQIQRKVP